MCIVDFVGTWFVVLGDGCVGLVSVLSVEDENEDEDGMRWDGEMIEDGILEREKGERVGVETF